MSLVNAHNISSVLAKQGVVIIKDFLDPDKTHALKSELAECFASEARGSIKGAY